MPQGGSTPLSLLMLLCKHFNHFIGLETSVSTGVLISSRRIPSLAGATQTTTGGNYLANKILKMKNSFFPRQGQGCSAYGSVHAIVA